jgi:subtilisin family serine protease
MKNFLILIFALASLSATAFPTYEPFAYAPGTSLIGQINPDGHVWEAAGPAGPEIGLVPGNLRVPNLLPSQGNRVRLSGVNGPAARLALGASPSSGSVYYSMALQVANVAGLDPNGATLAALNNATGGSPLPPNPLAARLLLRPALGGYQIGITKLSTNNALFVWAPPVFDTNASVLVVAQYTFNGGPGNDAVSLWVNPDPSSFEASSAPPPDATSSAGGDIPEVQSFVLMQRPNLPATTWVDELRVGDTWAGVTPAAPVIGPWAGTLWINEWLADNASGLPDDDGDFSDWIELSNRGETDLDLGGLYLTDTTADPTQWEVPPGTVIPAGGFLVIYASGKDRDLHTNFELDAAGETIALYAPDGVTVVDQVSFGPQEFDVSEGRWPDGAPDVVALTPTPNAPNQPYPTVPTREFTIPFELRGSNSVFFHLFNVVAAGPIRIEAQWEGVSETLSLSLTGRRRPDLTDVTAAYGAATGVSPLAFSYQAAEEDVERGVGWRLVLRDPSNVGLAKGTLFLTIPYPEDSYTTFNQEKVSLRSGDFWPTATLKNQFLDDLAASSEPGLHAVFSITRALTCDEAEKLADLELIRQTYLAGPGRYAFGYVGKGLNFSDPLVAGILGNIVPLEPEDKVDPNILLGNYAQFAVVKEGSIPANTVLNEDGSLELTVVFARDTARATIESILKDHASAHDAMTDYQWEVTTEPGKLVDLAAQDEVEWIGAGPAPEIPDNDNTRSLIGVDAAQSANIVSVGAVLGISYDGFSGSGVTAGVQDGLIDYSHPDLNVAGLVNAGSPSYHATHVAGILAGSGVQSSLNDFNGNANGGTPFQWRGMAPWATLVSGANFDDADDLLTAIQDFSLDLLNRSQSVSYDGDYNAENERVDSYIRGGGVSGGVTLPRRLHVYSAGNYGTAPQYGGSQIEYYSLTKQMKNVVIVGNWDYFNGDLASSSSLGPCHDGRIKPDLVAPGTSVQSTGTLPETTTGCYTADRRSGYASCSGTSMASPAVAGVAALLLEAWNKTYSAPLGYSLDDAAPWPSTLRAILIQTAQDIVNANVRNLSCADVDSDSDLSNGNDGLGVATATVGPDYTTGWGLVDAQAAINLLLESRLEFDRPTPNRILQDSMDQGASDEYDFVVAEPGPVQVTLAWDDVEGAAQSPAVLPLLVNDLDLELVDPSGKVFYPWQLGQTILDAAGHPLANDAQPPGTAIQVVLPYPAASDPTQPDNIPANALTGSGAWVATQGKDHLNNVEQVLTTAGSDQIGHWKVRVLGFDVKEGTQDFSVVGFPYPDLPELVVYSSDKVSLSAFDKDVEFSWTAQNQGQLATGSSFEYRVWLSRDFYVDTDDVLLTDANQKSLGPLNAGASVTQTSSVRISQAQADALMGASSGTTSIQDLQDADVFLLVEADSNDDVLEHNESNVTFVQLARPVDVVMVMDCSGSMDSTVPVSSGSQRKIDVLKDSANLFLDLMRLGAGDQLAEVSFSSSATVRFGPDGKLNEIDSSNIGAAKTAANALAPEDLTDIEEGLQTGLDLLTASTLPNQRRVLIFFSDGMKTAGGDPTKSSFLQQFEDEDVNVYSVGFGTKGASGNAGIDVGLLEALTTANGNEPGFFHVTESAVALDKFFVNALAGAIRSEVVVDPEGDLSPGQSASVEYALGLQDWTTTLILTWDNPASSLDLAVRTPSGLEINAGNAGYYPDAVSMVEAPTYKLMTIRCPLKAGAFEDHVGDWELVVRNPGGVTAHYTASVIADSTLRASMDQPMPSGSSSFYPSTPVPLQMSLREAGGVPVTGAKVTVTPTVPLVSLGNLLAGAGVTAAELSAVPTEIHGEPLSDQERLYLALVNRYPGSNLLVYAEGEPFEMTETDGQYSSLFTDTSIDGVYSFVVRAQGRTSDCQPFQRELVRSIHVPAAADADHSNTDVNWNNPDDPQSGVVVTVTPELANGFALGPGRASTITITPDGGLTPASGVEDQLDGSYSQRFFLQEQGTVHLTVNVDGVTVSSLTIDTTLPAVRTITPAGAYNDEPAVVTIAFAPDANFAGLQRLALVSDDQEIPLTTWHADPGASVVQAEIPAGLSPGLYRVRLGGALADGPMSDPARFRVVGRGQEYPEELERLNSRLDSLAQAASSAAGLKELGLFIRDLNALPEGLNWNAEARKAVFDQAVQWLSQSRGLLSAEEVGSLAAGLDAAKVDARSMNIGPVSTPAGNGVVVHLGNRVSVNFSSVTEAGSTHLTLREGPSEFPAAARGVPHVMYEIISSAHWTPGNPVRVTLRYEAGDFTEESSLRLYHLEKGQWMDRTTALDTTNRVIEATSGGLGRFVIAQGAIDVPQPVLEIIGFDPAGHFGLRVNSGPGRYEIQRSVDLKNWTSAGVLSLDGNSGEFIDPEFGVGDRQFYRVLKIE